MTWCHHDRISQALSNLPMFVLEMRWPKKNTVKYFRWWSVYTWQNCYTGVIVVTLFYELVVCLLIYCKTSLEHSSLLSPSSHSLTSWYDIQIRGSWLYAFTCLPFCRLLLPFPIPDLGDSSGSSSVRTAPHLLFGCPSASLLWARCHPSWQWSRKEEENSEISSTITWSYSLLCQIATHIRTLGRYPDLETSRTKREMQGDVSRNKGCAEHWMSFLLPMQFFHESRCWELSVDLWVYMDGAL